MRGEGGQKRCQNAGLVADTNVIGQIKLPPFNWNWKIWEVMIGQEERSRSKKKEDAMGNCHEVVYFWREFEAICNVN